MAIKLNSSKLVTVYGGSGFVGRYVTQALARTGCRIRVAVRRPDLAGHLQPLGGVGQIHAVQANLRYPDSVAKAAEGADAIVNLVGILYETGKQKFSAVQAEGARNVARAAKATGAEALSDDLRLLLSKEMLAIQSGMMAIIPAYVSGNWGEIESICAAICGEFHEDIHCWRCDLRPDSVAFKNRDLESLHHISVLS